MIQNWPEGSRKSLIWKHNNCFAANDFVWTVRLVPFVKHLDDIYFSVEKHLSKLLQKITGLVIQKVQGLSGETLSANSNKLLLTYLLRPTP